MEQKIETKKNKGDKSIKIRVVFDSSKTSVRKGAHAIGCQN